MEERNIWIVEVNGNGFTIKSKTNPTFWLFAADDGTNKYNNDYDVRCHDKNVISNMNLYSNFFFIQKLGN